MSRDGSISFDWGDIDDCRFRLALGDLDDLQVKTGTSAFALLDRLRAGRPMVKDMREVLRHGLIGAGTPPPEAARLVARWADARPPAESIVPAIAVLAAALYGDPDDEPGKSSGVTGEPTVSPPMAD